MVAPTFSMPRNISHLVHIINQSAHKLGGTVSSNANNKFSLQNDAESEVPASEGLFENQDARTILLSACQTLLREVMGPTEMLKNMALIDKHNLASLQVINHYRVAHYVPIEGQISMQDLAVKCGLPVEILARVLRLAMTYGVFYEPEVGSVVHTEASLEIPRLSALLWYQLEICWPSTLSLLDWLKVEGDDKTKAPFQIAHSTNDSWWSYAEKRPTFIKEYGKYMAMITNGGPHDVSHVVSGFKWDIIGDGIVIDVGGADGFVATTLAQANPNLTIIVQDSVNLKESADIKIPPSLMNRVFFVPHSFFDAQLALGRQADVFLLRHILHDWEDDDCLVILRRLSESMKPGARIIVAEQVLGKPGKENLHTERVMRALDMQMLVQFGGKERTLDNWRALFKLADPAFEIVGFVQPPGSADTLMELQKLHIPQDAIHMNGNNGAHSAIDGSNIKTNGNI